MLTLFEEARLSDTLRELQCKVMVAPLVDFSRLAGQGCPSNSIPLHAGTRSLSRGSSSTLPSTATA